MLLKVVLGIKTSSFFIEGTGGRTEINVATIPHFISKLTEKR